MTYGHRSMYSGWHTASYHHMSSGLLSGNWYLIRMSYDNVVMSSGWHTLPFLCHLDEIANFEFPQNAVALQRFRTNQLWCVSGSPYYREYMHHWNMSALAQLMTWCLFATKPLHEREMLNSAIYYSSVDTYASVSQVLCNHSNWTTF